jgi:hypothetical protein
MTVTRRNSPVRLMGAAGSLVLGLGVAMPAAAQEDSRWLAWTGCWEPAAAEPAGVAAEATRAYVVCVAPAEGGARFATIAEGETVAERLVVADGSQRPIDQAGCRGWESAQWSQDNQRVFLRSELTCDGGTTRSSTGVLAVHTPEEWIDVQGVSAGENIDVRVRRYRAASAERISAAGARAYEDGRALALATSRTAAAQELTLSDVTEAADQVDAAVVEALLVERESAIRLDADALLALDEAGVAGSTIDLMVAQANPDKFMIDRASGEAVEVPEEEGDDYRRRGGYAMYDYDPFWYGYPGYYGRYSRYGYGYGYGDPYSYWYGRGPQIIIIDRGDGDDDNGGRTTGRMVKGRGFVPNAGSGEGSRSSVNPPSRSSGGSSGTVSNPTRSSGGDAKSSTGSTRKAKRRGGK